MQNFFKYLSISKQDKAWGKQVVTAGYSKIEKQMLYPLQNHPQEYLFNWNKGRVLNGFYVVYIASGKGMFESEVTGAVALEAGTCFFLFPNTWHRYQPSPEHGWEEYWLGLQGEDITNWISKGLLTPDKFLFPVGLSNNLINLYLKILDYIKLNPAGLQQIITGVALEILGLVLSTQKKQSPETMPEKIEWAKSYIKMNLEQAIYYEEIARNLYMSYSLFRSNFKNLTGSSPGNYHLQKRLEKAQDLLSNTLLPVEEIAQHLGFESIFYFSRVFKKKCGCPPSNFRKEAFDKKG